MSEATLHLVFSYPGSKWRLGKKYVQLFPQHTTFVDVFGGSGAMIARKSPSNVEVLNDLDMDVINVFRVIQSDKYPDLVKLIEATRNTKEHYAKCRAILDDASEMPVRKAWSFIACGMMGFNIHPCLTRTFTSSPKATSRLKNCPKWLAEWRSRLKNVRIENEPWQAVIAKHDAKDTLFFLDPPYMPGVKSTPPFGFQFAKGSFWPRVTMCGRFGLVASGFALVSLEFTEAFVPQSAWTVYQYVRPFSTPRESVQSGEPAWVS